MDAFKEIVKTGLDVAVTSELPEAQCQFKTLGLVLQNIVVDIHTLVPTTLAYSFFLEHFNGKSIKEQELNKEQHVLMQVTKTRIKARLQEYLAATIPHPLQRQ